MKKLLVCLILVCCGSICHGEQFRYRFTPGEVVRYRMSSTFRLELGVNPDGPFFGIPMKLEGIGRQETKSLADNSDAELAFSVDALKLSLGNESFEASAGRIPVFKVILSPTGEIREILNANITMNSILETQLYSQVNLLTFAASIPENVKGKSWSREVRLGEKSGVLTLTSRLISPDTAQVDAKSSIDLRFPLSARGKTAAVQAKGAAVGKLDVVFAPELGKTRKIDGTGDVDLAVTITGEKGAQTTYVRLRAATFEAVLMDSKAQPPASE